ncbi:MAG: iron-sulfur cluster assembly protein [Candidatus Cloacimonadota bacterium]|nr:iron-sulfur cluster assembly protein [Candidatus Cloacimonadota bacterium]
MSVKITKEDVYKRIEKIEHPEISKTFKELGMIGEVKIENNKATINIILPMLSVPIILKNILVSFIKESIKDFDLELQIEFSEMNIEGRMKFFEMSKAYWKGTI